MHTLVSRLAPAFGAAVRLTFPSVRAESSALATVTIHAEGKPIGLDLYGFIREVCVWVGGRCNGWPLAGRTLVAGDRGWPKAHKCIHINV